MGQELECRLQYRRRTLAGKAYLETDFLLFRGEERLKIAFQELKSVRAEGGLLHLEFTGGPAALELGKAAEKWAAKILNPPTRSSKLGLKPGLRVRLEGLFEADFLDELKTVNIETKGKAELLFLRADMARDLTSIPKLKSWLLPAGALWVVYPKGVAAIREVEVLETGRTAGLTDTKVVRFSATHTALRFVIRAAKRPVTK